MSDIALIGAPRANVLSVAHNFLKSGRGRCPFCPIWGIFAHVLVCSSFFRSLRISSETSHVTRIVRRKLLCRTLSLLSSPLISANWRKSSHTHVLRGRGTAAAACVPRDSSWLALMHLPDPLLRSLEARVGQRHLQHPRISAASSKILETQVLFSFRSNYYKYSKL